MHAFTLDSYEWEHIIVVIGFTIGMFRESLIFGRVWRGMVFLTNMLRGGHPGWPPLSFNQSVSNHLRDDYIM